MPESTDLPPGAAGKCLADDGQRDAAGRSRISVSWLPYVLPLAVYMLGGQLESWALSSGVTENVTANYPFWYTVRIGLTLLAMVCVARTYRSWAGGIRPSSAVVGALGAVVWIGLCHLGWERQLMGLWGGASGSSWGARPAFNPVAAFHGQPLALAGFLAVRFLGLACVVPICEEFFLRGYLVRFVSADHWQRLELGDVSWAGLIAATLYGVLTHPQEALAATVWFSGVSWWMLRSRSIWDCIVVHAVTNALLGTYVLASGQWQLW